MQFPVYNLVQEVSNSYATDPTAQALLQELAVHSPNEQGFALYNGLIKQGNKLWIGNNAALQTRLLHAFHSSPVGGHSGVHATYQRINKLFTWSGLKRSVADFVTQCTVYQQAKHEHCKLPGLLQPLSTLKEPGKNFQWTLLKDCLPHLDIQLFW
jgi:hypothetical protein